MRTAPRPFFILAMDHRAVMRSLFAREGEDATSQTARFARAKELAYEAMRRCIDSGRLAPEAAAVLVDGEYGGSSARAVIDDGRYLIMPVEVSRSQSFTSDTPEFVLDGGDEFGANLSRYPIDMVKALIVHNPGLPADRRERQVERARTVGEWCRANDVAYMIELLTPPTAEQRAGGMEQFEETLHTDLLCAAIAEYHAGGVEPDVWKIEPLAGPDDYRRVAGLARSDGRDNVDLVLLGGGADIQRVADFVGDIQHADGFTGFAIGRSLWQEAFDELFSGRATEEQTVESIGANLDLLVSRFGAVPGAASAATS